LKERIAVGRRPDVLGALIVTIAFMTGVFSIYTYIAPFLQQTTGLTGSAVAIVLFVFGVGATIGNLAAGAIADRIGPRRVVTTVLFVLVVIFSLISIVAETVTPEMARWIIVAAIGLWGLVGFSFPSTQQMRLVAMEPRLAPITLSLNASAGYVGVSLGAMLGSIVVAHHAVTSLGWVAAGGELTAFSILLYTLRTRAAVSPISGLSGLPASTSANQLS
jgi:predicted MFS family arabinose efflux permease